MLKKYKKDTYLKITFYGVFLLLAFLKLFIVSDNEILALNLPHDDLWYINAASHFYWFTEYSPYAFIHLPVFPLFIFFVHFTGISLRIIIEIFFLLSSFYFSYSLLRAGLGKSFAIITFFLMIFHPLSMDLFNRTLAETSFYTPLLIFSMANLTMLWINKKNKFSLLFSILTGISFALLWFTRNESILVATLFGFVLLIIFVTSFKKNTPLKKLFFTKVKRIIIIPGAIILFFSLLVNTANYFTFGIFAPSELNGTGYKSAYSALQKIKPSQAIRYVPVSTESREKAYTISPMFSQLRPTLENQSNFAFYFTKLEFNIDDEMGAGWFYWMFRQAVYDAGYKSGQSSDMFYKQMAKEINQAIKEKKIESRTVFPSFIDPYFYKFSSDFPASFLRIGKLFFNKDKPPQKNNDPALPKKVVALVDKMANRRPDKIRQINTSSMQGWAFIDNDKISKITLKSLDNDQLASVKTNLERLDVSSAFKKNIPPIEVPIKSGFLFQFTNNIDEIKNANIEFNSKNDSFIVPVESVQEGNVIIQKSSTSEKTLYFAIDNKNFAKTQENNPLKINAQHYIWEIYGNIITVLFISSLFFFMLAIITYKYIKNNNLIIIFLILLFIIFTRVVLFSILDIDSWNGAQPRYIFPVMPLFSTALLIIIYLGTKGLIMKIKARHRLIKKQASKKIKHNL